MGVRNPCHYEGHISHCGPQFWIACLALWALSFLMRSSNKCSLPTLYHQLHNLLTGYPKSLQIMSLCVWESRLKAAADSLMTSVRGVRISDASLFWESPRPIWSTIEITGTNDLVMTVCTFASQHQSPEGHGSSPPQWHHWFWGCWVLWRFWGRILFDCAQQSYVIWLSFQPSVEDVHECLLDIVTHFIAAFKELSDFRNPFRVFIQGIGIKSIRPILGLLHSVFIQHSKQINIRFLTATVTEGAAMCIIAITQAGSTHRHGGVFMSVHDGDGGSARAHNPTLCLTPRLSYSERASAICASSCPCKHEGQVSCWLGPQSADQGWPANQAVLSQSRPDSWKQQWLPRPWWLRHASCAGRKLWQELLLTRHCWQVSQET